MPERMMELSPAPTVHQWFSKPVVEPLISSQSLGWKHVGLYALRLNRIADYQQNPLTENHFLTLVVNGSTSMQGKVEGRLVHERQTAGSFNIQPAWNESSARWNSSFTAAFLELSPKLIDNVADLLPRGDPAHVRLMTHLNFRDPFLYALFLALYSELQNPGPLGTLFADSVSQTIMLHLLRHYSNRTIALQPSHTCLTLRQMRILNDYIEQHLDQKISLGDLAALLFMSISHFERTFRNSQGCPPYRYVLECRVERAQRLLRRSELSIYEVARACGFANQSHFTKHFTQFVGISPARFAAFARK